MWCLVFVVVQALMRARGRLGGTEWIQSNAMKLRRELSTPVFVAVARQLRISAQIIFFPAKGGGAVQKGGAGLRVEVCLCYSGKKTVY